MPNLLLEKVEYKVVESDRGTWRRYLHPNGAVFADYTSKTLVFGLPLLHYTRGLSPETGTYPVARGFVAVGRRAVGVIAIGRFAAGALAIGQLSLGLAGFGQLTAGLLAVGQLAAGGLLGIGQIATGLVCVAQLGLGKWVLAQLGLGQHVWSMRLKDPQAIEFFKSLAGAFGLRSAG